MRETIQKILETAIHAPSGDNAQPWRFMVRGNEVSVYNVPTDTTVYNFRERGSYVAHGALIENIFIASSHLGYRSDVVLFPENGNSNLVARIIFHPASPKEEPLYPYIIERATNRKPYKDTVLSFKQREVLLSIPKEIGNNGKVVFIEDKQKKGELAWALSQCDRLIFENKAIHDFLFTHVNWTDEEEQKRRSGLYVKTLELAPPQIAVFKLFKKWGMARFLSALGLPKFIAKENTKLYATSSAISVILVNGDTNEDFVIVGRIMQRIWLHITKMGLSMQPITASSYLAQRVFAGEAEALSDEQISMVKETYKKVKDVFDVKGETIGLIFRVGNGGKPSARSLRLKPDIKTI